MFCQNCGTEVGDSQYCPNCGKPQGKTQPYAGEPSQYKTQSQYQNPPQYQSQPQYQSPPNQGMYGQPQGMYSPPPGGRMYGSKDGAFAAILSFFIPGLGQIYVGNIARGIGFFFGTLCLLVFFVGIFVWIINIFDANNEASKYNNYLSTYGRPPMY